MTKFNGFSAIGRAISEAIMGPPAPVLPKVHKYEIKLKYVTCPTCDGSGVHVHPSIDSDGLSADDLDDNEFMEGYRTGRYDVSCFECKGVRKTLTVDRAKTNKESLAAYDAIVDEESRLRREEESERRYGA